MVFLVGHPGTGMGGPVVSQDVAVLALRFRLDLLRNNAAAVAVQVTVPLAGNHLAQVVDANLIVSKRLLDRLPKFFGTQLTHDVIEDAGFERADF